MCTPYIYIESQTKWLPLKCPLEPRNRLCLHRIAWPRKPTSRIKQRVDSYHTTEVIAHRNQKVVAVATSHRCRISAIYAFHRPTTQTTSITNCLVAIVHIKPVNNNFSPKVGCHGPWQWPLHTRSRLRFHPFHQIAWPRKPTPRIKQHVASYHTTKVIATKPVTANCVPKLVAMATSLSTSGPQCSAWFPRRIRAYNPNGISTGSAVFAQMTAKYTFTLQWDAPFPPQTYPFHGGSGPHLTDGSLGPPESSTQTASRSVQPFLQGSLVWQTDRPTDRPRYSVGNNRLHLRT